MNANIFLGSCSIKRFFGESCNIARFVVSSYDPWETYSIIVDNLIHKSKNLHT